MRQSLQKITCPNKDETLLQVGTVSWSLSSRYSKRNSVKNLSFYPSLSCVDCSTRNSCQTIQATRLYVYRSPRSSRSSSARLSIFNPVHTALFIAARGQTKVSHGLICYTAVDKLIDLTLPELKHEPPTDAPAPILNMVFLSLSGVFCTCTAFAIVTSRLW